MVKFKKNLFSVAAILLTFLAMSVATSACYWCTYQPEEPKCLSEK
jgi:cyclic lactone autoinducer peptide